MIRQRYAETKSTNRVGTKAAVDLFLHAYREEKIESSKKTRHADELDAEFVLLARNNVKTLLLGGHDTSSTSIAYTIALLSEPENRPELERVRAEHDEILGTDPSQAAAHLLSDPTLLGKLPLTTAAVKESLRMFPPATTTRTSPAPSKYAFHLSYPQTVIYNDTTTLPITGQQIWINSYGMGQRADLWPEPRKFKLDRFLPGTPQVKDAWRPFEKGPRGCIGLELAMMEMKLVLVLVLREFEFEIAYADDAPRAPLEHGLAGGRGYQVLEFAGVSSSTIYFSFGFIYDWMFPC
jgi:cytochrome P450